MVTFLNLDIEKPVHWKFLIKHVLYSTIWILGVSILVFRVDFYLHHYLPDNLDWVIKIFPFIFLCFVFFLIFKTKWYYNLVLIFYPILVMIWFLPKMILHRGKIYLLSNYISYVFKRFKHFKRSVFHFGLFVVTIFILIITDSNIIRTLSMLIMTYFYYRYVIGYVKLSFRPAQLFGTAIDKSIGEYLESPTKKFSLVKTLEEQKSDKKLTEEEQKKKRLERLIIWNFVIESFSNNLNGFKGKKAFVISWIYQLIGFIAISLTFFTLINFELFLINNNHFTIIGNPKLFDFFYYTIKTITFNNIDNIMPLSSMAKIIEIFSFLTLGVFLLIFVTSVIFSLRQDRINENIKKATDLCIYQNEAIAEHIKLNYQTDITTVLNEAVNIRNSIENLKKVIEKIF